jgi:hypothetical protein
MGCQWGYGDYATPEHCQLVESINDSICKSINSDYEFRYDSMMTKGADKCVWTVRKNGDAVKEKPKGEAKMDDPVKMLAMRYAKGEIAKEELEERLENLKRLGLVKY